MGPPLQKEVAIAFIDVHPPQGPNCEHPYKIIALIPSYDPDLKGKSFTGTSLPYSEVFSSTTVNTTGNKNDPLTTFKSHMRAKENYWQSANLGTILHLQWGIVNYPDCTKMGELVGTAAVRDNKDPHGKETVVYPIYRCTEYEIFPNQPNKNKWQIAYIATLGAPPRIGPPPPKPSTCSCQSCQCAQVKYSQG